MFGETVVFKAGIKTDRAGAKIPGPADFPVSGCVLDWTGSTDIESQGHQAMSSTANIYIEHVPPGFVLSEYEQVMVRGMAYKVQGRGSMWQDPEEPDFGGLVVTIHRGEG